jgi:hypothetical protein
MEKFTKFADWESRKYIRKVEEDSTNTTKEPEQKNQENSALIAQLADVVKARKEAIRNKDDFEAQILEIESKLIKLDIERNDLVIKKADLVSARDISATERKEAKTNVKEN